MKEIVLTPCEGNGVVYRKELGKGERDATNGLWVTKENGVKKGNVRVINGRLCFAWSIIKSGGFFLKNTVLWADVKKAESLNERADDDELDCDQILSYIEESDSITPEGDDG